MQTLIPATRPDCQIRRFCIASAIVLVGYSGFAGDLSGGTSPQDSLRLVLGDPRFRELKGIPGVKLDLRYASTNNFMHQNVYGEFKRAFLHKEAVIKLTKAAQLLSVEKPEYQLLVLDALRPRSVQRLFWAKVKGTPQEKYVADPEKGSIHNFGFAVDLTIVDETGKELDMGTGFDAFLPAAEPRNESKLLQDGELTPAQVEHRKLLRRCMEKAGFIQLEDEWWHYDAKPGKEVRSREKLIE